MTTGRPLYLTEDDVARLADIRDAVDSLQEAFAAGDARLM